MLPLGPVGYKRRVPFRRMLSELVTRAPGARGAIFCDYEGENVDLAVAALQPSGCAKLSDYDLKICGAQLASSWMLLQESGNQNGSGNLQELKLRCTQGTLLCRVVRDGYYLVLLLAPGPRTEVAAAALRVAARAFAREF